MSASWPGNMRGPRVKTPLLMLLLLLITLTGTVLCQYDDDGAEIVASTAVAGTEQLPYDASTTSTPSSTDSGLDSENVDEQGEGSGVDGRSINTEDPSLSPPTSPSPGDDGLSSTIILIPVVLVVVIIAIIVCCIFIKRRWNNKAGNQDLRKEDPYLNGPSTENVPMPMFEEDVPSVLELEMEELDQWMKKDEDSKQA